MSKKKKVYRLFISHSWAYNAHYDRIIEFLKKERITFYNHSVPKDNPVHTNGTDKQLKEAIEAKMIGSSCILLFAGVYATHSKWINKEIDIAQKQGKSIIAIEPWGSERTSKKVKDNADVIVKWQGKSIADAIKQFG